MTAAHSKSMWQLHRYREQARSHKGSLLDTESVSNEIKSGSGLAREAVGTFNITAN